MNPLSKGEYEVIVNVTPVDDLCEELGLDINNEVAKGDLDVKEVPKYMLTVTVLDEKSANPIEGAEVEVYDSSGSKVAEKYTDSSGKATFKLVSGKYKVRISKEGYIAVSKDISVDGETTLTVYLKKKNSPPVVDFSSLSQPVKVRVGTSKSIDLTKYVYDPNDAFEELAIHVSTENSIVSYELKDGNKTLVLSCSKEGSDKVKVKAVDPYGASDEDSFSVECVKNSPPVIKSKKPEESEISIKLGESVTFEVKVEDADGDPLSFVWKVNGYVVAKDTTGYTFKPGKKGIYTVTFEASDGIDTARTSWKVSVFEEPEKKPPVAIILVNGKELDEVTVEVGEEIEFDASRSYDIDGKIVSYYWDLGDGTTSTKIKLTHAYSKEGTYTVKLKVKDNDGLEDEDTVTVCVKKPETYKLTFLVVDKETGEPLEGAVVKVDDSLSATTDKEGKATFELSPGTHTYKVSKEGYKEVSGVVTVESDKEVKVELEKIKYTVTFEVLDEETAEPIKGAKVTIDGLTEYTDEKGKASFTVLPGTYTYKVEKEGYESKEGTVKVEENTYLTVYLKKAKYTVTFLVVDKETGEPLEGAVVKFGDLTGVTDKEGKVEFSVAGGKYSYKVTKEGYKSIEGEVDVSGDVTVKVEIEKEAILYTVTFEVVDKYTAKPIEGAKVKLGDYEKLTNSSGHAEFQVGKGTYSYTVSKEGYKEKSGEIEVSADTYVKVELVSYEHIHKVTFKVKDYDTKKPLEGVKITVDGKENVTDSNGEASFELEDVEYSYTAEKEGYESTSGKIVVESDTVVEIMMKKLYTVTFKVVERGSGSAVKDAKVEVNGKVNYTNEDGVATLALTTGEYTYTVSKEGYKSASGKITVPEILEVTVELEKEEKPRHGGGGGGGVYIPPAEVKSTNLPEEGFITLPFKLVINATPYASIKVLIDGKVYSEGKVSKNGTYEVLLTSLEPGYHKLEVYINGVKKLEKDIVVYGIPSYVTVERVVECYVNKDCTLNASMKESGKYKAYVLLAGKKYEKEVDGRVINVTVKVEKEGEYDVEWKIYRDNKPYAWFTTKLVAKKEEVTVSGVEIEREKKEEEKLAAPTAYVMYAPLDPTIGAAVTAGTAGATMYILFGRRRREEEAVVDSESFNSHFIQEMDEKFRHVVE